MTPEKIIAAHTEVARLTRELDITNADHIALWLEANVGGSSLAWLACRIVEAHETTLTALSQRIAELEAENARLHKLVQPEWFYLAGDMSSDCCRFSVQEVIDEDWLWNNRAEGTAVVQIETAVRCPDIWALVRFFTTEEKDARQSDDDYEITEYASEEAASAALKGGTDA